jgi:ketosteroid isomerase-like protein
MAQKPSVQLLKDILAAFNSRDIDKVMAFFAEDCVLETPRGADRWGRRFEGAAAVREGLQRRFTGMPDVTYTDDSHYVDGDSGMSKWTIRGTDAVTDQKVEANGCDFFTFRNGLVVRKDSYWKIIDRSH